MHPPHPFRARRKSCSTSAASGVDPSVLRTPRQFEHRWCNGSSDSARQNGAPPQLPRLFRRPPHQRGLDKKFLVSSDHVPPISTARTIRRALWCGPTNSGHVFVFLRRAASRVTLSKSAARPLVLPSDRSALTNVVSMANWAPPEQRETIRHNFQMLQIQVTNDVL